MLATYLKIAYRNLLRYKSYSIINILGLAVGIGATILILLYIQFEFSYDNFHQNADRIFRVSVVQKKEGNIESDSPVFTPPIGPAMTADFPEVENYVRLSTFRTSYFYYNNNPFKINAIRHADSSLFDMFSFGLIAGNPKSVLANPYSLVLTEQSAERIFGAEEPVGKTLTSDDGDIYTITGIAENPPANSHIQFNALISFSTLYLDPNMYMGWNGGNQYLTYVRLIENSSPEQINNKFPDFMWKYINNDLAAIGVMCEPYLQPLRKIHLHYSDSTGSGLNNLSIFSAIAFLILLIACINFIDLTTAQSGKRAKEVGIRKVMGADKKRLIIQFLTESVLLSLFALVIAIIFVEISFPLYKELLNKDIGVLGFHNISHVLGLIGIVLLVGIIAGSYPALCLSSFQPVKTLKGVYGTGARRVILRNTLVVLQFVISITLIICTVTINNQLNFMENKSLGFNKENVVVIPLVNDETQLKAETLKKELQKLPDVVSVAASSQVPIAGFTSNGYFPEGLTTPLMIHVVDVDEGFLKTFDINLVMGRNFSSEFPTDDDAYVINESLARLLGWENPINKTIRRDGHHPVIGVVKDFHFATLYDKIEPLIITNRPWRDRFQNVSIRIRSTDIPKTLSSIKNTWEDIAPAEPFEYWFLNEAFDHLYKWEQRFRMIIFYFSCLALSIALLGLYSLASFSTEQRTKEIGVRKVLGATVPAIVVMLSKEFTKWVLLANIIAWPIAYYGMNRWLENFAYRVDIGIEIFIGSALATLAIAMLTVSFQAIKAATTNPVNALRYE